MTKLFLVLFLAGSFAGEMPATAEPARQSAQDRPTDATIKSEVEQRLAKKGLTEGTSIEIVVDDHMISLEGFVQSLEQKQQATKVAMKAKGASHVMNHLTVARWKRDGRGDCGGSRAKDTHSRLLRHLRLDRDSRRRRHGEPRWMGSGALEEERLRKTSRGSLGRNQYRQQHRCPADLHL